MPLTVLAAGGRYKWVQLHDARVEKQKHVSSLHAASLSVCRLSVTEMLVKITARR